MTRDDRRPNVQISSPADSRAALTKWRRRAPFERRYSWIDREGTDSSRASAKPQDGSDADWTRTALDLRIGRRVVARVAASEESDISLVREAWLLIDLDHTQLPDVVDQGLTEAGRPFFVMERPGTLRISLEERGTLQGLLLATGFLRGLVEAESSGVVRSPSPKVAAELEDGSVELSVERWSGAVEVRVPEDLASQHAAMREALKLVLSAPETQRASSPDSFALRRIEQIVEGEEIGSGAAWLDRLEAASRLERHAYQDQRLQAFIQRSPRLWKAALTLAIAGLLVTIAAGFAARQRTVLSERADLLGLHVDASLLEDRRAELWGNVTPPLDVLQKLFDEGQRFVDKEPQVRAGLEELGQRGRPTGRMEVSFERELSTQRSELASMRAGLEAARKLGEAAKEKALEYEAELIRLGATVEAMELQASTIQEREFDKSKDGWEYVQLGEGLRALQAVGSPEYGWLNAEVLYGQMSLGRLIDLIDAQPNFSGGSEPWRASWQRFEEWLDGQDSSWDRVRRDLERQPDLAYLGLNETSGYPEFLHVPAHLGELQILQGSPEAGKALVLVLLPGGLTISGEQSTDKDEPRYVARAADGANGGTGALAYVDLAPFFIAKYEVSQAQWIAWTGSNPWSGDQGSGQKVTLMHPVDGLSAATARGVLRNFGMDIPSEAQWEYAARAGSESQWPWGDTEASLAGKANLNGTPEDQERRGDTYRIHAPVGSFEPNDFGLYDVIGNVKECCAWTGLEYWAPLADADVGIRIEASGRRNTFRGGCALDLPKDAKCAGPRFRDDVAAEMVMGGVRPIRTIRPIKR